MYSTNNKIKLKITSSITVFLFLFSTVINLTPQYGFAESTPIGNGIGSESLGSLLGQDLEDFSVPYKFGEIKERFHGDNGKTVIHIQDAHCNYTAQRSIEEIIRYLTDSYGIYLISLEGGKGKYDLSSFTRISDPLVRKDVSDYFLREGRVSGAEDFAINSPFSAELFGVEDTELYFGNLNAYRASLEFKEDAEKLLGSISHMLKNLKNKSYTPGMKEADEQYTLYLEKSTDFKDYVFQLQESASNVNIDISEYPNLMALLKVLEHEKTIDFKKANRERNILIDDLSDRLSGKNKERIALKTIMFKNGEIPVDEFYAWLFKKARFVSVDFSKYINLRKYYEYIKGYEAIDKSELHKEIASVNDVMMKDMFQDEDQRELYAIDKDFRLLQQMFEVALVRDTFDEYLAGKDKYNAERFILELNKKALQYGIDYRLSEDVKRLDGYRDKMEEFYTFSFKRDKAFLDNIADKMEQDNESETILVTGGFHADNLADLFRDEGYTYVKVMPKFKTDKSIPNPYFQLLSGESNGLDDFIVKSVEYMPEMSNIAVQSLFSQMGVADARGRNLIDLEVEIMEHYASSIRKGIAPGDISPVLLKLPRDEGSGLSTYIVISFGKETGYPGIAGFKLEGTLPFTANIYTEYPAEALSSYKTIEVSLVLVDGDNMTYEQHEEWIDGIGKHIGSHELDPTSVWSIQNSLKMLGLMTDEDIRVFFDGDSVDPPETVRVWEKPIGMGIKGHAGGRVLRKVGEDEWKWQSEIFLSPEIIYGVEVEVNAPDGKYLGYDEAAIVILHELGAAHGVDHATNNRLNAAFEKLKQARASGDVEATMAAKDDLQTAARSIMSKIRPSKTAGLLDAQAKLPAALSDGMAVINVDTFESNRPEKVNFNDSNGISIDVDVTDNSKVQDFIDKLGENAVNIFNRHNNGSIDRHIAIDFEYVDAEGKTQVVSTNLNKLVPHVRSGALMGELASVDVSEPEETLEDLLGDNLGRVKSINVSVLGRGTILMNFLDKFDLAGVTPYVQGNTRITFNGLAKRRSVGEDGDFAITNVRPEDPWTKIVNEMLASDQWSAEELWLLRGAAYIVVGLSEEEIKDAFAPNRRMGKSMNPREISALRELIQAIELGALEGEGLALLLRNSFNMGVDVMEGESPGSAFEIFPESMWREILTKLPAFVEAASSGAQTGTRAAQTAESPAAAQEKRPVAVESSAIIQHTPDHLQIGERHIRVDQRSITQVKAEAAMAGVNNVMAVGMGTTGYMQNALGPDGDKAFPVGRYEVGTAVLSDVSGSQSEAGWNFVIGAVIHQADPSWEDPQEDKMKDAIKDALRKASEEGVRSISIPQMGTGALGLDRDTAANWIMVAVEEFLKENPDTSITDITFALSPRSAPSYLQELGEMGRRAAAGQSVVSQTPAAETPATTIFGDRVDHVVVGSTDVSLISGDITQEPADAVVVGWNTNGKLGGKVLSSMFRAMGYSTERQAREIFPERAQQGVYRLGEAYPSRVRTMNDASWQYVINGMIHTWSDYNPEQPMTGMIAKVTENALKAASDLKLKSISLPTMGTGGLAVRDEVVSREMFEGIKKFLENNPGTSLTDIKLVVYHRGNTDTAPFQRDLLKLVPQDFAMQIDTESDGEQQTISIARLLDREWTPEDQQIFAEGVGGILNDICESASRGEMIGGMETWGNDARSVVLSLRLGLHRELSNRLWQLFGRPGFADYDHYSLVDSENLRATGNDITVFGMIVASVEEDAATGEVTIVPRLNSDDTERMDMLRQTFVNSLPGKDYVVDAVVDAVSEDEALTLDYIDVCRVNLPRCVQKLAG